MMVKEYENKVMKEDPDLVRIFRKSFRPLPPGAKWDSDFPYGLLLGLFLGMIVGTLIMLRAGGMI